MEHSLRGGRLIWLVVLVACRGFPRFFKQKDDAVLSCILLSSPPTGNSISMTVVVAVLYTSSYPLFERKLPRVSQPQE